MSLHLIGVSHRTAPIEERERMAIPEAALPEALESLCRHPGVVEGMILSTCNRVEVLIETALDGDAAGLAGWFARAVGVDLAGRAALLYRHDEDAVVRHVFRVAASLDSMVVGESQILGQLKHAFTLAGNAGTVGPQLEALLARAFHAAKRVRTETEIASQPVSVSHIAVDLARQVFGDLRHKTVLLVGAGAMGELAVRYLMQQGASRLLVANRTLPRAEMLAAKFGGIAFALGELDRQGARADVVISCTGAGQPLITRAQVAGWLMQRRRHPMLFVDLAVPRDVEPDVHRLENAFVYNIDDLEKLATSNLAERLEEAGKAEAIIEAEVRRFTQRRRERGVVPTLRGLQDRAERMRLAEWERMRRRLGALTPEQELAVEALTRGLVRKLLHHPLVELKNASGEPDGEALVELARRLFALPDASAEPAAGPAGEEAEHDADGAAKPLMRDGASG